MSTYNTVSIVAPDGVDPEVFARIIGSLPDLAGDHFSDHSKWEEQHGSPLVVECSGNSKYYVEEVVDFAVDFTALHSGWTVSWWQEWDDDNSGQSYTVYRYGDIVREESEVSRLTPLDLPTMIENVRQALGRCAEAAEGDSNDEKIDAAIILREEAAALINALDPSTKEN